jgi:hypothetical protein
VCGTKECLAIVYFSTSKNSLISVWWPVLYFLFPNFFCFLVSSQILCCGFLPKLKMVNSYVGLHILFYFIFWWFLMELCSDERSVTSTCRCFFMNHQECLLTFCFCTVVSAAALQVCPLAFVNNAHSWIALFPCYTWALYTAPCNPLSHKNVTTLQSWKC